MRIEENNKVIGMIAEFADSMPKDSYVLLTTIATTLMDISKSLAIIADSLSEWNYKKESENKE